MIPKPYEPPLHWHIKKTFLFLVLLSGLSIPVKGQITRSENVESKSENPFANPALIYGTDFLRMFQLFYKQGQWETMIKFTSRESINRIGRKKLLNYYRQMDFGYSLQIYSLKKQGELYMLNYKAKLYATEYIVRCIVNIENDTCRIVLSNNILQTQTFLFK